MQRNSPPAQAKVRAIPAKTPRQSTVWILGPRQFIVAIVGVLLYGIFSHVNFVILLSSNSPDIFLPALLIPLLFGVIFGPWVGLIVGGFGFLLGDYAANTWLQDLAWNNGYLYIGGALNNFRDLLGWSGIPGYLVNALIGVSAGFIIPAAITRSRFNSAYALATAAIWATVSVTLGIAIVVYSTVLIYQSPYYTFGEANAAFVDTAMPNLLITLIIFPLLLWLYDRVIKRRKHP